MDEALATRLRSIPWPALEGHVEPTCAAVASVLAGEAAERALDRTLRGQRRAGALAAAARAAIAESIFGVGLWRRRLAAQLGIVPWESAPARLLLLALVRDLGGLAHEPAVSLIYGARGDVGAPPPAPPGRAGPERLADRWSLPDWLEETLLRELGTEAPLFATAVARPGPVCLRANRLRMKREALAARLREEGIDSRPTRHAPDGLQVLTPRPNLLGLASEHEGLFEVQDEGSQLLVELVEAGPGATVLDLCAGAGGKALALAAAVGASGRVLATDVDGARLARLARRAARAGAPHVAVAESLPPGFAADAVLVDAPCSELGPLRRGPDTRFRLQPATFLALVPLQRTLLARGAAHVRPGGRLVYATCTLRREENEEVAAWFTAAHPGFVRVRPAAPATFLDGLDFRALPHRHDTDGFYAAVWRRDDLRAGDPSGTLVVP